MNELFAIGFTAGLALAIPVGPMAIMLVNTTIARGWRHGFFGALAMATVDFSYAFIVFLIGKAIFAFLSEWATALSLAGAAILLWLGVATLWRNIRLLRSTPDEVALVEAGGSRLKTFVTFAGATVINPPTALYFLAIAPSISRIETDGFALSALVFAIGVFVGSVIWQQGLAAAGLGLRSITSNLFRVWFGIIGGGLIIALAISIAIRGLTS